MGKKRKSKGKKRKPRSAAGRAIPLRRALPSLPYIPSFRSTGMRSGNWGIGELLPRSSCPAWVSAVSGELQPRGSPHFLWEGVLLWKRFFSCRTVRDWKSQSTGEHSFISLLSSDQEQSNPRALKWEMSAKPLLLQWEFWDGFLGLERAWMSLRIPEFSPPITWSKGVTQGHSFAKYSLWNCLGPGSSQDSGGGTLLSGLSGFQLWNSI